MFSPEHYPSESYSSPGTSQPQYQEQTGFENQSQSEQPMTPATPTNMRITRNTRARLRGMIQSDIDLCYRFLNTDPFFRRAYTAT